MQTQVSHKFIEDISKLLKIISQPNPPKDAISTLTHFFCHSCDALLLMKKKKI